MSKPQPVVGWIGLGAMGAGMSKSLLSQGFQVKAFDTWAPSLESVVKAGGIPCKVPAEAAEGVDVLALMVVNAAQVEDVLFGAGNAAAALKPGSAVIVFSTVPPTFLTTVQDRLLALGVGLCDSPVSGGSSRAAEGTLTVMCSATAESLTTGRPVLEALTRKPDGNLSIVGDSGGIASSFKLINQVLCITQITLTSEVMAFASKIGLNPRMVYNIIPTAAGDSFMFRHRIPWQLRHDGVPKSAMTIAAKDVGIVNDEAKLLGFPAPVSAATEQLLNAALGAGLAKDDDGLVIKLFYQMGVPSVEEKGTEEEEAEKAKELSITPSLKPKKVLFVGLGVMGNGMAMSVHKAGLNVVGFDINLQTMDRYAASGGQVVSDVMEGAKDAEVVVMVPNTATQAEAILFGSGAGGICSVLPSNATIVLGSTIAPYSAESLQKQLDAVGKGFQLIDAPISGGPSRANIGDLAIFASGQTEALGRACTVLQAMSLQQNNSRNLHFIPGGVGSGSKMKAVNQLLAGVHMAITAEALAFSVKKGMDLDAVLSVLSSGAAYSYVMVDRAPRMRMANPPVFSALDTMVKDVGIVLAEAKRHNLPLFLTSAAYQQFLSAQAMGWGREDDSCLAKLWEQYGIRVRASA